MKKLLLLLFTVFLASSSMMAQRTVHGTVTDDSGSTLIGATVVVKSNPSNGVVTDYDGKYSLKVASGAKTLLVSYIGYTPAEVAIGASDEINVSLSSGIQLDNVIVTALGIRRAEKSLGYAAQKVDGSSLTKAREANIVNSLNGKVAGVQITNSSGAVGSSSRIVLRGASSITGNNEPLFIVDGVPINNTNFGSAGSGGGFDLAGGIADLNPDDIDEITVLKGPNAAGLYGIRAANGVVVITTKKGKSSKSLGISFNSSTMFQSTLVLPDYQNSYGQGGDNNTFEWIDGSSGDGGVDESWGPPLDIGLNFIQWDNYKYDGKASPWISHPNNIKDFYETGLKTANNLSFSNGNDVLTYRLSLGHSNEKGIIPNTDYVKYNVSGNSSLKIAKKFTAELSLNYVKSKSDNLPTGGYNNENPVQQMIWSGRNVDLNALRDYKNLPLAPKGTAAEGTPLNWNNVFQNNPFWVMYTNLNKMNKDRVIGNVGLNYEFTDKLSLSISSGIDYFSMLVASRKAHGSNNAPNGSYSEVSRIFNEINSNFMFNYRTPVSSDIEFGVSFGGNKMTRNYNSVYGSASELELPGLYTLANLKSGATPVSTSLTRKNAINSLYGTGQIAYKNALYIDITGRNDWSSLLPIDNNSFFYPSVTVSAILSDLFHLNNDYLSFLKVRGGWAKVGSSGALTPYQLEQTYSFRTTPYGDQPLLYNPNTLKNPNINPETTIGLEFGLDARLFNNKLRFDATYYDQTSKDLIVPVEISASTGYIKAWQNVGEMRNKGIELQLGATLYDSKNLTFDMDINFAKNNNEVVSLGGLDALILGGQWNVNLEAREGMPYGVLFGPSYLKDDNGNIVHSNGVPVIDSKRQVLGDIQPDWTGGVTFNLYYKGIGLNTIIDGKKGGSIYSMTSTWGRFAGVLSETLKGRETGIIGDGVKNIGTAENPEYVKNDVVVSAEVYNKAAYSNSVAEGSVFDASYIKLRQVMLTFDLPKSLFGGKLFHGAAISLVGRNLAILHRNAPHIDPESAFSSDNGEQGQEFGQLPSVRSYGVNLSFKF